jgi:hypothetical protein
MKIEGKWWGDANRCSSTGMARAKRDQPLTLRYYANRRVGISRRVHGVALDARGDWVGVER